MRNLTIFPMSSYKGKLAGLACILIALILSALVKFFGPLSFIHKLDGARQFILCLGFAVYGMFQVAFSKEKNEDERVQKIRAKSMQSAFMYLVGITIAVSLSSTTASHDMELHSNIELLMLAAFGLGVYLVLFHVGLYFDPSWNYNDDTVLVNIRKNKRFFIFYLIAVVLFFALVLLIHKA